MNLNTVSFDEFGRDLSLRRQQPLFMSREVFERYKKMSWAEICWEIEEEEERIKEIEENRRQQKCRALDSKRKRLWEKGEYELEEGEIFE